MPNAPNVDGLPPWLALTVTLLFGFATLLVAIRGYFRPSREGAAMLTGSQSEEIRHVQTAAIMDMGVLRHLSDVCIRLTGQMESMEQAIRDQTHWTRNDYELNREICARLRELKEVLERSGIR